MTLRALIVLVLVTLTACGTSTGDVLAEGTDTAGRAAADSTQAVADVESAIRRF